MDEFGGSDYAVRQGRITRSGTYFAEPGGDIDPMPETRARRYSYPAARIADFRDIAVTDAVLREALDKEGAFGKRYGPSRLGLLRFWLEFNVRSQRAGLDEGWMPGDILETLGLAEHAKRLGYDGARVWRKGDILAPTSVCIWNTELVEPVTDKI